MSIQNTLALTALPVADSYDLLLTAAATLHENGEETHGTLVAIKQFGQQIGLETTLSLTWGEVVLQVAGEEVRVRAAVPTDTNMRRVLATQRADLHAKSAVSFALSKEQCQLRSLTTWRLGPRERIWNSFTRWQRQMGLPTQPPSQVGTPD